MSLEQYSALIDILPQIETALKKKGEDVPRPKYGEPQATHAQGDRDDDDEDQSLRKANIEATSDEDE